MSAQGLPARCLIARGSEAPSQTETWGKQVGALEVVLWILRQGWEYSDCAVEMEVSVQLGVGVPSHPQVFVTAGLNRGWTGTW